MMLAIINVVCAFIVSVIAILEIYEYFKITRL